MRMDAVGSNMGNPDNSVNYMSHMLEIFVQEMRQGSNQSPVAFNRNNKSDDSTKV